jgi:hypothetical protein
MTISSGGSVCAQRDATAAATSSGVRYETMIADSVGRLLRRTTDDSRGEQL